VTRNQRKRRPQEGDVGNRDEALHSTGRQQIDGARGVRKNPTRIALMGRGFEAKQESYKADSSLRNDNSQ